ncbi:GDSL/SGNH-like acyl-esterase family found in Pmr5 and Cas1p-domain-containing protein [Endogone sp. FLAS-F59071]|nr:GDSL/SGNH-like acyl-esterase family found in Pmr5 and Cas1p-domain-containing protein [Endogone sp. FLAS-F59071]|eukprot:RUS15549.1 GDSL/SGNH-like acyl-esterase family found in Pmr5 and Cas1p-domain-containing protein [Endogone sp. FLAS-F59071]
MPGPLRSSFFRTKLCISLVSAICLFALLHWKVDRKIEWDYQFPSFLTQPQQPLPQPQPQGNLCTPEIFNKGTFVRTPLPFVGSHDELIKKAGYQCSTTATRVSKNITIDELMRQKKAMEWTWNPDSCDLLELDPDIFTRHLEDNPLLFLGDSITRQQYVSLRCLLGRTVRQVADPFANSTFFMPDKPPVTWRSQLQSERSAKSNKTIVMFSRSDFLVRSRNLEVIKPGEEIELERDPYNFAWSDLIPKFKYVVINTGAHWSTRILNTTLPILDAYQIMIDRVLEHLSTEYPHVRVFIRGSVYGHFNCSQYTEPFKEPKLPTPTDGQHNWFSMLKMNDMWKESIYALNNSQITYFDISFTELRGDGHADPHKPDCLHYLLPGPMDTWNKLLYHEIIKELQR